jgi:fucose permease
MAKPSAKVVAWLIASSSLGAISVPWLVGIVADWRGIIASLTGLLLLSGLLLGVVVFLLRKEASTPSM